MESDSSRSKLDEPLNVVKASRQYVFTDNGEEYLDCLNGNVHIGHSHPQVIFTLTTQINVKFKIFLKQNISNYYFKLFNFR